MAKKKRKYLIKLNNKIRNHFDGLPFDERIATLDNDHLTSLTMSMHLELASLEREELLRGLRRVWSEGDHLQRADMLRYLQSEPKNEVYQKEEKIPLDKVSKILMLLEGIEHSKEEENKVLETFVEVRSSKVTLDKIKLKLKYLRLQERFERLEDALGVSFTTLNEMEFYQSYTFSMSDIDFKKLLLTTSESIDIDRLLGLDDATIITHLLPNSNASIDQERHRQQNSSERSQKQDDTILKMFADVPSKDDVITDASFFGSGEQNQKSKRAKNHIEIIDDGKGEVVELKKNASTDKGRLEIREENDFFEKETKKSKAIDPLHLQRKVPKSTNDEDSRSLF